MPGIPVQMEEMPRSGQFLKKAAPGMPLVVLDQGPAYAKPYLPLTASSYRWKPPPVAAQKLTFIIVIQDFTEHNTQADAGGDKLFLTEN